MLSTKPQSTEQSSSDREHRSPVLKTTRYDKAWSLMIAVVMGLVVTVFMLLLIWWSYEPVKGENDFDWNPISSTGDPAGDKSPLEVISPDPPRDDPAVVDSPADISKISEVMDSLLELSDDTALHLQQQSSKDEVDQGPPGSKKGSKKNAIGDKGRGKGGNGDRWFISFADQGSLALYRQQLDFFEIEIGHFDPVTRELTYVKNFSTTPTKRVVKTDKKDPRFYFLWQGGGRKKADAQLLRDAGIHVTPKSIIVHFYSKAVVEQLARTEVQHTNRPLSDIGRTYFGVRPDGSGFKFVVTRMTFKN